MTKMQFKNSNPVADTFLGIYIHIPFCKKKCNYCDFLSFLLPCQDRVADYILALKKELELAALKLNGYQVASVYIGGGTPSLLSAQNLKDILSAVEKHFTLSLKPEITVEANPGTLSREKLREMAAMGVNRLSLGVQSFDNRLLAAMGRVHSGEEAVEAFCLARQEGFTNINIDLIYGLPGQVLENWEKTLAQAIELAPEHVSAYGLTLEKGTPWGDLFSKGELHPIDEDTWVRMHDLTMEVLPQAGIIQYEISNYSKPGYESLHNLGYWYRRPYIGVGLGASSFLNETRYKNHSLLEDYYRSLRMNKLPLTEEEVISTEEAMSETIFLGMRTVKGVNTLEFKRRFGREIEEAFPVINHLMEKGIVRVDPPWMSLNPHYYGVSNEVFLKFV